MGFIYLNDLIITQEYLPITVYEDNQSTIKVCQNPEFHGRIKHIEIKYHFIRDQVKKKNFEIRYISSQNQQADMLTKPLNGVQLSKLSYLLGLED